LNRYRRQLYFSSVVEFREAPEQIVTSYAARRFTAVLGEEWGSNTTYSLCL
jgi:hypothetical protein